MNGRKILRVGLIVLTVLVIASGAVGFDFFMFYRRHTPETKVISIERGWNLHKVSRVLEAQGVVSSAFWMVLLAKVTDQLVVQAGEYRFEQGRLPGAVLAQLQDGTSVTRLRFVVPEGLSIKEIVVLMEKQGWKDAGGVVLDPMFAQGLRLDGEHLEGWMFPDTYFYRSGDLVVDITRRMVARARKTLQEEWENRPKDFKLTAYQALILASIVEKETGQGSERPLISGVFQNRIKRDMMLQSDPTVIYGIENFDGNITRKHLTTPTPYNTYMRKGLPPTPICNPGRASIHAVFYPESTRSLYFVANGNGAHVFSSTLEEHEKNVDIYQRRGKRHP